MGGKGKRGGGRLAQVLSKAPKNLIRGQLIREAESGVLESDLSTEAICKIGFALRADGVTDGALKGLTQFAAERAAADKFDLPLWKVTLLRVVVDFELATGIEALETPASHFGPAGATFVNYLASLAELRNSDWLRIRWQLADEFTTAAADAPRERDYYQRAAGIVSPAALGAAQIVARDIARVAAWTAITEESPPDPKGKSDRDALLWDVAWSGSAGDLARRGAIAVIAAGSKAFVGKSATNRFLAAVRGDDHE